MKNINVNVQRPPTNIPLGRQGENLATCVIFDCSGFAQLYGDGTSELLHELKDGTIYPVAATQDGTSVSWIVTASDTATVGAGRAELRWYVGDTLAKSAKFRTSVSSALPDTSVSTPPAPQKAWVDKVLAAAQEIKDGAISEEQLAEAIAQALADAKASGEFDGAPGKDGADGQPGTSGKSAYQYAQEGGYTGAEEEFAAKMAQEIPTVDATLTQAGQAADAAAVGEQLGNLSEEIANLPQPDWNQNDETAVDYVKNRPFYEETTEETILGEYTGELSGLKPSSNLVYGDKYVIYLDEIRYDTECTEDSDANNILYVNTEHGWINILDYCWEIQTNITGIHTLKVVHNKIDLYKIDSKFIDFPVTSVNGKKGYVSITASDINAASTSQLADKMNKSNPVGMGSFSMGRKSGSTIGDLSHAEGQSTTASGRDSHAEGHSTTASKDYSHAEGQSTTASGSASHAEGESTTASGSASHAEGYYTTASGSDSHAEGEGTTASGRGQHVQGRRNIIDTSSKYAHIVGNGADGNNRSNAHTLDWNGVPWFQGRPQFGGTAQDDGSQTVMANGDSEIILTSTGGKKFSITVDDSGALTATEITT